MGSTKPQRSWGFFTVIYKERSLIMDFKRGQDTKKSIGLGYGNKMKTSSWKILEFIGSKGEEGAGLTEIQKYIYVDLQGKPEAEFWEPTTKRFKEYYEDRGRPARASYEKTRASRGHWNTNLYGSSRNPGLLHKYCRKNPITKKWVLERMPKPGENIYEEKSNKFISETLNEFLNNRYIK